MERNILLTEEQIQSICHRLGQSLTEDLKNEEKTPVFLGVMKGALNFMMDLIKNVTCPINTDYIQLSSYVGTKSSGSIIIKRMFEADIKDRTLVIVEDIIDTGLSMQYLVNFLHENYKPKRILIVALFDKTVSRKCDIKIDYAGSVLKENAFLLGYGLDYNEYERNVPYIYSATEEDVRRFDELAKR